MILRRRENMDSRKNFGCHSERSEEPVVNSSTNLDNRSLAALGMTLLREECCRRIVRIAGYNPRSFMTRNRIRLLALMALLLTLCLAAAAQWNEPTAQLAKEI